MLYHKWSDDRYVKILKHGLKALASESGVLQMKLNISFLQYRKMLHITTLIKNIRITKKILNFHIKDMIFKKINNRTKKKL